MTNLNTSRAALPQLAVNSATSISPPHSYETKRGSPCLLFSRYDVAPAQRALVLRPSVSKAALKRLICGTLLGYHPIHHAPTCLARVHGRAQHVAKVDAAAHARCTASAARNASASVGSRSASVPLLPGAGARGTPRPPSGASLRILCGRVRQAP